MNKENLEKRIREHYEKLVLENYEPKEAFSAYNDTVDEVVNKLMPYALNNNFWWEEKSTKMAYYQLQTNIMVVDYYEFMKYYKKLVGHKFEIDKLFDKDSRKKVIEEATQKYNNTKKR